LLGVGGKKSKRHGEAKLDSADTLFTFLLLLFCCVCLMRGRDRIGVFIDSLVLVHGDAGDVKFNLLRGFHGVPGVAGCCIDANWELKLC
jgi:hypothetical protein